MQTIKINKKPFKWLINNRDKRFLYLYGGASSSKSHTVGQFLCWRFFDEKNIGILIIRKTRPATKASCWVVINGWLKRMGFEEDLHYKINRSDLIISANGNFMMFDGLDNVFKKKSIEGINYVWVEEPAGIRSDAVITEREFTHIDIICRAHNENGINQLISTFNPIDPVGNEWLEMRTKKADLDAENSAILMLNHEDNPFLAPEEHARIEVLANKDPEYDKIYRQGLWATPTHIIYTNWDIVPNWPERFDEIFWGLDFGYSNNPAALVELRFCGDEIYEQEHIYQTSLTNPELIEQLKQIIEDKSQMIVADSAEPKSIQEIKNAGFNIHPCQKGPDSVRFGINTVKSFKLHIIDGSDNLIKEKKGYKWKQDKEGNPLPEPLRFRDHLMDAERYAISKIKGIVFAGVSVVGIDEDEIDEDEGWETF